MILAGNVQILFVDRLPLAIAIVPVAQNQTVLWNDYMFGSNAATSSPALPAFVAAFVRVFPCFGFAFFSALSKL